MCPNMIFLISIKLLNLYITEDFDEEKNMYSLFFFLLFTTTTKTFPPKHLFTTTFFSFLPFSFSFTVLELSYGKCFQKWQDNKTPAKQ